MDNYSTNSMNQVLFQATAPKMQNITNGQTKKNTEEIDRTAKEFEAMFIGQMLNLMFENVSADPMFGDKADDEIYRSMLLDQYGKKMAESSSMGIADQVRSELLKLQEVNA